MRLVLDTNAALELFHFHDPRCARLRDALAHGRARCVTSTTCRAEFHRVLRYPALVLDAPRIAALETAYDAACDRIDATRPGPLPRCRDRDDQIFLELARDAGAAWLLTRDAELLRLSRRTRRDAGFFVATPESFEA